MLRFFPSTSISLAASNTWLRICTPEFSRGSTLNSSSRMKSPYSLFVHRKELGVLGTLRPTTAPSSTEYLALPPCCVQPSSDLPSNSGLNPSSWPIAAPASAASASEQKDMRIMVGPYKNVRDVAGNRL